MGPYRSPRGSLPRHFPGLDTAGPFARTGTSLTSPNVATNGALATGLANRLRQFCRLHTAADVDSDGWAWSTFCNSRSISRNAPGVLPNPRGRVRLPCPGLSRACSRSSGCGGDTATRAADHGDRRFSSQEAREHSPRRTFPSAAGLWSQRGVEIIGQTTTRSTRTRWSSAAGSRVRRSSPGSRPFRSWDRATFGSCPRAIDRGALRPRMGETTLMADRPEGTRIG